jgi:hypothetical protein
MKPRQVIVTSANSPQTIPLDPRSGPVGLGATPDSANYTVVISFTPLQEGLTANTFPIAEMTAATTAQQVQLGPVLSIIVTLNSGTSVTIDLNQANQ